MSKAKTKPSVTCTECGRELWSNESSALRLCRDCVVSVMDIQGDLNGIMTMEDDEAKQTETGQLLLF